MAKAPNADQVLTDLGRRVAEIRESLGLTQEDLAEHLGFTAKYLQRVEGGRENLSVRSLVALAEKLQTEVVALFQKPRTSTARPPGRPRKNDQQ